MRLVIDQRADVGRELRRIADHRFAGGSGQLECNLLLSCLRGLGATTVDRFAHFGDNVGLRLAGFVGQQCAELGQA